MTNAVDAVRSLLNMLGKQTHDRMADPMFRYLALNPNRWVFLGMADASGETRGQEVRRLDVTEVDKFQRIVESIVGKRFDLQNSNAYISLSGEGSWTGKWISVLAPPVTDGFSFTISEYVPEIGR